MSWVDLRGRDKYKSRPLGAIRYLVVHHSAVPVDSTAEEIAAYHTAELGWPGIGYHFLVHWSGQVEYVGDILTERYNVATRNREVVGICLPGDWSDAVPPGAQLRAARELIAYLRELVPWAEVVGHGEIAVPGWETACPGATFYLWRGEVGG